MKPSRGDQHVEQRVRVIQLPAPGQRLLDLRQALLWTPQQQ
jgi:hypothetical protein